MKEYDDELIEEIKDRIDIVDFISEYTELKRRGRDWFGKCPFHDERTASFCVTPSKQTYYCFGCGVGGDIITFCMSYLEMGYEETITYLSGLAGINANKTEVCSSVKFFKKMLRTKKAITASAEHKIIDPQILNKFNYGRIAEWEKEGIPQSIMQQYGVAYHRQYNPNYDRIVYPVYDLKGNLINIKGRTVCENYNELVPPIPKYMNYYPVGDLDYFQGLNFKYDKIIKTGEIIIFEGFKSVMKADSYGYINSVSAETSTLTLYQVRVLVGMHVNVVIAFDQDVPLEKIKTKNEIRILSRFTNVYVVCDKAGILGDPSLKKSPVDCGKKIWEQLYRSKIKI